MNKAIDTTFSDLTNALNRSLAGGELSQQVEQISQDIAKRIVEANKSKYPDLVAEVTRSGPATWSISISAPGLWSRVFGTLDTPELGFEIPNLRGDST